MNREQIEKYLMNIKTEHGFNLGDVTDVINKIYNSFETQVCNSCKYNNDCMMQTAWKELQFYNLEQCDDWDKWTSPFGCNKHETKEKSNE